ncbi:9637_t:CDS:2 [Paraglomus brasilianum]|uniref:9637_t:CDS:1 n=1 Tax=Paraglomus brasilianum TaxID=144538 RepID=A0A9N9AN10_9GLOM|nr:9637_t:CDS:2 [Paraglomus brasilianum]
MVFGVKTIFKNQRPSNATSTTYVDEEAYMTDTESESAYTAEVIDTPTTQSDVKIELEGENRDTFILVPGLLGYDTLSLNLFGNKWVLSDYWSGSREMFEDYIVVRPSAFGSLHDRAVDIFYQLKGGRVDYGHQHSEQFSHNRYGKTYGEGLFPEWSEDNPIVLVGKGYGATTALYLQHLLSSNFFPVPTSGKWIKGIISYSAPHRGSTLPYALGLEPGSTCIVHPLSILQVFVTIIHLICYFTFLDRLFDLQLNDKWGVDGRDNGEASFWSALNGRSKWSYFGDNFLGDWSVEGARRRFTGEKDRFLLDPACVYINYVNVGSMWKSNVTGHYWPRLPWRNLPSLLPSLIVGRLKFSPEVEQSILRTRSSTYWENDGTLSIVSQLPPPNHPVNMNIALLEKLFDPVDHELQPGAWYNVYVKDVTNTVLFDGESAWMSLPIVIAILEWKIVLQFGEYFERNSKMYDNYYVEFVEFMEKNINSIRSILGQEVNEEASNNNSSSTKECTYTSDKAALEWMRRIETAEMFKSPSRLLYWMNNFQKTHNDESSSDAIKADLTGISPFGPSSVMEGPMFVRARQRMTAEQYKASILSGDSEDATSSSSSP